MSESDSCQILLLDNALYHWFVLVPKVPETELHELGNTMQQKIFGELMHLSRFVKTSFDTDKVNIGAIGNIVNQLHIHVIGRRFDDATWPSVVWGAEEKESYTDKQVTEIRQLVIQSA